MSPPPIRLMLRLALFLLFAPLLVSPQCSSSTNCPFFGDVSPVSFSLSGQSRQLFNYSLPIATRFSLFYLRFSNPYYSFRLIKYDNLPSNVNISSLPPSSGSFSNSPYPAWNSRVTSNIATLLVHSYLPNIHYYCDTELQATDFCRLTIEITNTGSSSANYDFFAHYDDSTTGSPLRVSKYQIVPWNTRVSTALRAAYQWQYFGIYIDSSDFDVLVTLAPDPALNSAVDLYISGDDQILRYFYPSANTPQRSSRTAELQLVLNAPSSSASDSAGFYVFGVFGPTSQSNSPFAFTLQRNYVSSTGFGLSLFGLIGAIAIMILLILFCAAFIARRRSARINAAIAAAHQGNFLAFQQAMAMERERGRLRPGIQIQLVGRGGSGSAATLVFPSRPEMEEQIRRIMLNGFVQSLVERVGLGPFQEAGQAQQQPPAGASDEEIASLPLIPYSPDQFADPQDAVCSICLEELKAGDTLRKLRCPCKACYHSQCIETWLKGKRHCPMCRSDVTNREANENANGNAQAANPRPADEAHPLRAQEELPV